MTDQKALPCPFCGGTNLEVLQRYVACSCAGMGGERAYCAVHGDEGPVPPAGTREEDEAALTEILINRRIQNGRNGIASSALDFAKATIEAGFRRAALPVPREGEAGTPSRADVERAMENLIDSVAVDVSAELEDESANTRQARCALLALIFPVQSVASLTASEGTSDDRR